MTSLPTQSTNTVPTTLLLTAVAAEGQLLLQALTNSSTKLCGHVTLTSGYINGQRYAVAHAGLGKSSTAAALAAIFNCTEISRVIMLGCAGAYPQSGLQIGDIATATKEIFADEGVLTSTGFIDLQQLGFPLVEHGQDKYYHSFPCASDWLSNNKLALHEYAQQHKIQHQSGPFATLSTCSGSATYGQQIYQRTGAIAENMEGAAAAQVCTQYHKPFTELRAISNMVEDRDTAHWDLPGAMQRAQHCAIYLLHQESD
ncbi:MAG: futalosine hydrolase [Desulfuromonas sp.]|nr:futalosine hydrolase [Desulfuromonas sp.]